MFIPVIIPPQEPSPRAKELGEQIALFVMEYRQDNPQLSSMELQQAFMLARQRTNKELGGSANIKAFIALGLGLAMLVLLGVLVLFNRGGGGGGSALNRPTVLMIVVGAAIVLFGFVAIAAAIKRSKL